jgi:broad specificity phosphatase PhoE
MSDRAESGDTARHGRPAIERGSKSTTTMRGVPLIFVRHGETDWNRELRFQGQKDIPMNERGRRQAARNGRAVASILAAGEWRLVASPLGRSVETMRLLLQAAGRPERPFATDAALVEVHYGDWEGLTLGEIAERYPEESRARDADKWGYFPPNGESYSMLSNRVAAWLSTLKGPTFVVAHGGVLRALMHLLGGLPSHDAPHLAVPQDRVILFTQSAVLTI